MYYHYIACMEMAFLQQGQIVNCRGLQRVSPSGGKCIANIFLFLRRVSWGFAGTYCACKVMNVSAWTVECPDQATALNRDLAQYVLQLRGQHSRPSFSFRVSHIPSTRLKKEQINGASGDMR